MIPNRPADRRRRILLADCDMFFVQVARLEDPEGAGRIDLLLVGGRSEHRGVITSASYAARAFGVRSGMPTGQALRLCPAATVVPVPRGACSARSREVRAVLARFAPVVEAASIDEFYLDLSGTERLYGDADLAAVAARIQHAVKQETRIDVSLGGGAQRTVAKMAVRLAKPAGVFVVPAGEEAEFMRRWKLRDLPFVGPVLAEELRRRAVVTVDDALGLDLPTLTLWVGEGRARWLHDRIRGIDDTPVEPTSETKSVSHERTFARDVLDDDAAERALLRLACDVGASLRHRHFRARTITVKVKDADFRVRQASRTLESGIESDRSIYATALPLFRELRTRRRTAIRLLGISSSRLLVGGEVEQGALFEGGGDETDRDRTLSRAADGIRARFGEDALRPARILPPRARPDGV